MTNVTELLTRIRSDVDAKKYSVIDLAREAGIPPTTLYSMLDPEWKPRWVEILQSLVDALSRLTQPAAPQPATPEPQPAAAAPQPEPPAPQPAPPPPKPVSGRATKLAGRYAELARGGGG